MLTNWESISTATPSVIRFKCFNNARGWFTGVYSFSLTTLKGEILLSKCFYTDRSECLNIIQNSAYLFAKFTYRILSQTLNPYEFIVQLLERYSDDVSPHSSLFGHRRYYQSIETIDVKGFSESYSTGVNFVFVIWIDW